MRKTSVIALFSILSAAPAFAQAPQTPPATTLRLSVDEAVSMALDHNIDLNVDRLDPQISDTRVAAANGAFKPTLGSSFNSNNQLQPPSSFLIPTATRTDAMTESIGVGQRLSRFGTQYRLNMKLHATGQGELLSGSVAGGATAEELEGDLRPAVRRLVAPLLQDRLSDQRREARETTTVQRVRPLPSTAAAFWIVAGYDWTSHTGTLASAPGSAFGWDLGGHLFFRVAGPLYLGALLDYSLSGPNELLAAGGLRLAVENLGISAGAGYANLASGGWGLLGAIDFGLGSGFSLRGQVSWRRASSDTLPRQQITVASVMGGLSLQF